MYAFRGTWNMHFIYIKTCLAMNTWCLVRRLSRLVLTSWPITVRRWIILQGQALNLTWRNLDDITTLYIAWYLTKLLLPTYRRLLMGTETHNVVQNCIWTCKVSHLSLTVTNESEMEKTTAYSTQLNLHNANRSQGV